jgi:hypothetical protein
MKTVFVTRKDRRIRLVSIYVTVLVACALLLAQPAFAQTTVAQHPWQKMQMPTAAEVAKV